MMMTQSDNAFDLEAAFDAARNAPPQMPIGLSARILADAEANLPPAPLLQRLMAAIGGTASLGGLVTATMVGLWIGVAPPNGVGDPLELVGLRGTAQVVETDTDVDEAFLNLSAIGWDSEEG